MELYYVNYKYLVFKYHYMDLYYMLIVSTWYLNVTIWT